MEVEGEELLRTDLGLHILLYIVIPAAAATAAASQNSLTAENDNQRNPI